MKNSAQFKTVKDIIKDLRSILHIPTEVMDDSEVLDLVIKYVDSLEEKEG